MTFEDFCEHLAKIEATPKRLQVTSLLADLLKQANSNEVEKTVMLALGRLAPLYKDIDFGLAEKTMIRAIALADGVGAEKVVEEFKRSGDLGETAMALKIRNHKSDIRNHKAKTSVSDAYDSLLGIARESGEGSQERKIEKTADLLRQLNPLGAKYAVRIILGNLRLGFSDKTVLDALSVMLTGDKSAREKLEAAYNVRPDVGALARQIINHKSSIRNFKVEPELGTPILPALCQRLPAAEEIIQKMKRVAAEPKWDGQRIQAHIRLNPQLKVKSEKLKVSEIHLFTRSLEDVTEMFPDLITALQTLIQYSVFSIQNCILDGEAVAIDPKTGRALPFQTMITRKRKYGIKEKLLDVPVRYMVFDILYLNGKSLMDEKFIDRRTLLEKIFGRAVKQYNGETVVSKSVAGKPVYRSTEYRFTVSPFHRNTVALAPQLVTSDPGEIRKFLKQQINSGLEGIVAKRTDAAYIPGRTQFAWVKLKWEGAAKSGGLLDTVDCVVMGTYSGQGKRAGFGVGAFLVGVAGNSGKVSSNQLKSAEIRLQKKSDKSESDSADLSAGRFSRSSRRSDFSEIKFVTISKIGTGLTDEQWRELKVRSKEYGVRSKPKDYEVPKELVPDTWLKPELVAEIQADNITKSPLHSAGYALRFPRLVRYRNDKKPEQATTLEEIKKLYEMQK